MRELILDQVGDDFDPNVHIPMGPWCFIGKEHVYEGWEKLDFPDDPFPTYDSLKQAERNTTAYAFSILDDITDYMNEQTGIEHSYEFWRIALIDYLIHFVQLVYEKQIRVSQMIEILGDEPVIVRICDDSVDFRFVDEQEFLTDGVLGDRFSTWLFSRIIEAKKPEHWIIEYKKSENEASEANSIKQEQTAKSSLVTAIVNMLEQYTDNIHIYGLNLLERLFFSVLLRIGKSRTRGNSEKFVPELAGEPITWDIDILEHIKRCIPEVNFRKEFLTKRKTTSKKRIMALDKKGGALLQLAGYWENGVLLYSAQHGSNYGTAALHPLAYSEYYLSGFITWGWEQQEEYQKDAKLIPLSSPMLCKKKFSKQKDGSILLVGTRQAGYFFRFHSEPQPLGVLHYREEKRKFINSIDETLRGNFYYRPYKEGTGSFNDGSYYKKLFPWLQIVETDFQKRLESCSLLVLDHPGTTFNIAMAANTPMIAYWDSEAYKMSRQATGYYDALEKAGVLFTSAQKAATKINELYGNIDEWWYSNDVQKARKAWCDAYARTSPNWRWEWIRFLWRL